jgi:acyl-CoA synthetase (AMP-forming)/AMP-acid ligase II
VGLAELGVAPATRIGVVARSEPWFPVAFFGVILAGAVPVPVAPPQRLGAIDEQMQHLCRSLEVAGAGWLVCEPRRGRRLAAQLAATVRVAAVEEIERFGSDDPAFVAPDPQSPALVQFSSGSTAAAKGVVLSHRALVAQARMLNGFWPPQPGAASPCGVSWLPMFHDMGLVGALMSALERPGTVTLLEPELFLARPALWLRTISRYRAAISAAPSFGYAHACRVIRDHELEGVDLSSWRFALNGAEPIDLAAARDFSRRFARWGFDAEAMMPVYGLAEATLAVSFAPRRLGPTTCPRPGDQGGAAAVCLGAPVPGVAIEIRNAAGEVVEPGREGHVWVAGPALMSGYEAAPAASAAVLVDGWLDTGDLGFLAHGELHLVGRAKDILIVNGRNLDPAAVEAAVATAAGVDRHRVAAFGARVADGPERVVVAIEVGASRPPAATIEAAVLTAAGIRPAAVVLLEVGGLPRTTSGKVRRGETRQRWEAGRLPSLSVGAEA